jgi:hypothetical protein
MIKIKQKGDFSDFTKYIERLKKIVHNSKLDKYGQRGVEALSLATPIDSGQTANSWYYKTEQSKNGVKISFYNSNVNENVPIAIILQYGHGTRNGGYVQGRDYINPAIQPIFDDIVNEAWKEVISL